MILQPSYTAALFNKGENLLILNNIPFVLDMSLSISGVGRMRIVGLRVASWSCELRLAAASFESFICFHT